MAIYPRADSLGRNPKFPRGVRNRAVNFSLAREHRLLIRFVFGSRARSARAAPTGWYEPSEPALPCQFAFEASILLREGVANRSWALNCQRPLRTFFRK
jgi:hypothetical protein